MTKLLLQKNTTALLVQKTRCRRITLKELLNNYGLIIKAIANTCY